MTTAVETKPPMSDDALILEVVLEDGLKLAPRNEKIRAQHLGLVAGPDRGDSREEIIRGEPQDENKGNSKSQPDFLEQTLHAVLDGPPFCRPRRGTG